MSSANLIWDVPGIDFGKDLFIGRIIISHQLPIVYAKAILPECKITDCSHFLWIWIRWGIGIGDKGRFYFVTTKGVSTTREKTWSGPRRLCTGWWAGSAKKLDESMDTVGSYGRTHSAARRKRSLIMLPPGTLGLSGFWIEMPLCEYQTKGIKGSIIRNIPPLTARKPALPLVFTLPIIIPIFVMTVSSMPRSNVV